MKKFLLSVFILGALTSVNTAKAQCDLSLNQLVISEGAIPPTPIGTDDAKYLVSFNASFNIARNGGFKYLFFHSWLAADYPAIPIMDCSKNSQTPGTSLELGTAVDDIGKSFLDLGFINLNGLPLTVGLVQDVTSLIATTWAQDPSVVLTQPSNSPGMTASVTLLAGDIVHFDITNVSVIINQPILAGVITKTDIWGSQQQAAQPKSSCCISGRTTSFSDPVLGIQKDCATYPFTYTVNINTTSTSGYNVTYNVYMDRDDDTFQEPGGDDGPAIATVGPFLVNSVLPYSIGPVALTGSDAFSYSGIYVQLTATGEFAGTIATGISDPVCLVFPVTLISFSAERDQTNVALKWETSQEENNRGFDIERLVGNGGWQKIGFVPSQGKGGSSHYPLTYLFTDVGNLARGISQYRLKQIDFDDRSSYSVIRVVHGLDKVTKTLVFPNPSNDGKVNVLFDSENTARSVVLVDVNGRTVKQWKGITGSNLQMDNLPPGFYSLRIINTKTNKQTVEKFIVNKR